MDEISTTREGGKVQYSRYSTEARLTSWNLRRYTLKSRKRSVCEVAHGRVERLRACWCIVRSIDASAFAAHAARAAAAAVRSYRRIPALRMPAASWRARPCVWRRWWGCCSPPFSSSSSSSCRRPSGWWPRRPDGLPASVRPPQAQPVGLVMILPKGARDGVLCLIAGGGRRASADEAFMTPSAVEGHHGVSQKHTDYECLINLLLYWSGSLAQR